MNIVPQISMYIRSVCLILLLALTAAYTYAQPGFQGKDPKTIKVDELTDSEIQLIKSEIEKSGMSEQELVQLAKIQGMPSTEINKLRERLLTTSSEENTTDFQGETDQTASDNLDLSIREASFTPSSQVQNLFGSSLFNTKDLTFEPDLNIPTPKGYVLGTGDEIVIDIWGASKQNYRLPISREGTITISNLSPIYLNGLSIETAEKRIKSRLTEIYAGLSGTNPNTYVQVSIGRLRSIKVTVIGDARAPGTYTIPSTATAFNALYLSGGPNNNGSMRSIDLIRNNRVYKTIDVYDFLVNGNQKANVGLQDQDLLRVNTYETRVELSGEVKRPMIYEIKAGENLSDALRFASGFTADAYYQHLTIHRRNEREFEVKSIAFAELDSTQLRNGDKIEVSRIIKRYSNRVQIRGAVYRPGDFEVEDGMMVSDLIQKAEGLREFAFTERALLIRTKDDYQLEVIPVNLSEVLAGNGDIALQREDVLEVNSKYDLQEEYTVSIGGAVLTGGSYPYLEDMTLGDLLLMANGFKDGASPERIEVARRVKDGSAESGRIADIFYFTITNSIRLSESDAQFKLEPFDQISVRSNPGYEIQQSISINGEVLFPGNYTLKDRNEYLSDIITRAGGLTPQAYAEGAMLQRTTLGDSTYVAIDLEAAMEDPKSKNDLILRQGDKLYIPNELQTVSVRGEVYNPVALQWNKKSSMKDYITEAGWYTQDAKRKKAYVVYPNGSSARIKKPIGLWKKYPEITPGSTVIVPTKAGNAGLETGEILAITTSLATIALLISQIVTP